MIQPIPIVFIRQWSPVGGFFYGVPIAIQQAKRWNPDGRVVFIGDDKQPEDLKGMTEFHRVEDHSRLKRHLQQHWPFAGQQDDWFLSATLQNWLILADWMQSQNVPFACCLDTDVLVYCDVAKECQYLLDYHVAWGNPEGTNQAPSFVRRDVAVEFASWLLGIYERSVNVSNEIWSQSRCCMSAWRHFAAGRPDLRISNLCHVVDGGVWDHNWAMADGKYEHDGQGKVMTLKNGQPWCKRPVFGDEIRFRAIHAWGPHKSRMRELATP